MSATSAFDVADRVGSWDGAGLIGRVPAGETPLQRFSRSALRAVTSTASSRELADLAVGVRLSVATGRRIAVVSLCGGAGRTTVTALLGSVFAARRADHVLVADADPDPDLDCLPWRLGLPGPGDLGGRLLAARGGNFDGVDALLPRTPSGLRLLPGPDTGEPAIEDVTRPLSRFFAISVTDCAAGLLARSALDVLSASHAAVVVAPVTPDGLRRTVAGLDRLRPEARSRIVLALTVTDRTGQGAVSRAAMQDVRSRFPVPAVVLPYDRHLAAGAPIELARLSEPTVVETSRLAGHALLRACADPPS